MQNLQEDDLVWFVDYLDKARRRITLSHWMLKLAQALYILDPSGPASRKCLRELGSTCATHTTFPTSYTIPSHFLTISPYPFDSGGFGEVYHGTLKGSPVPVCVKRLRVATPDALAMDTKVRY